MTTRVVLRVGNAADYETARTLDDAAARLAEEGVKAPFRRMRFGLECPAYRGQNYISLYWGRPDFDAARELSEGEWAHLSTLLANAAVPA
jgi:hypothetical protein